jgi:hypothetical protein
LWEITCSQVLTAARMKIRAFWDVAPCSLGVDRRFKGAYCIHHHRPDVGGSTDRCNVGLLQRYYTALHLRRLWSSTLWL